MTWREFKDSGTWSRFAQLHTSWWARKRGVRASVHENLRAGTVVVTGYSFMLEKGDDAYNSAWPESACPRFLSRHDAEAAAEAMIDAGWPLSPQTPPHTEGE